MKEIVKIKNNNWLTKQNKTKQNKNTLLSSYLAFVKDQTNVQCSKIGFNLTVASGDISLGVDYIMGDFITCTGNGKVPIIM